MINFRYHVVSLTAVFLALAIGLVVGTAALNGPAADALNNNVNKLSKQNEQYRDQVNHLEDEVNKQEQFAIDSAPYMLGEKLRDRRVLLVYLPGSDKYIDGVATNLQLAGAKVTGRVQLEDKLTEPASNETLLDLATFARPSSVTGLTSSSNGVKTSTALLAAVLLDRSPAVPDDERRQVLASYSRAGYLSVKQEVSGPAQAIIFVAPPPYVDKDPANRNLAVVNLVTELDLATALVVAGNSTGGEGNVLSAVRGDPTLTKTVSTVDNVATAQGRVVTVMALIEQFEGRHGHYGVGDKATGLLPKPVASRNA